MTTFRNFSTGDVVDIDDRSEVARLAAMPDRWERLADPAHAAPLPPVPGAVPVSDRQVAGKAAGDVAGDPDPSPLPDASDGDAPASTGTTDAAKPARKRS